jgi:hypothetical protein
LIGNASGRFLGGTGISIRGVFDEETRRKPLVFAADAVSYGIWMAGQRGGERLKATWERWKAHRGYRLRRKWAGRKDAKGAVGMVWAHKGIGVPEHIPGWWLMEVLGRIEVHACW